MNSTAPALGHHELAFTNSVMQLNETALGFGNRDLAGTKLVI
jgi:hypothetical protein